MLVPCLVPLRTPTLVGNGNFCQGLYVAAFIVEYLVTGNIALKSRFSPTHQHLMV